MLGCRMYQNKASGDDNIFKLVHKEFHKKSCHNVKDNHMTLYTIVSVVYECIFLLTYLL